MIARFSLSLCFLWLVFCGAGCGSLSTGRAVRMPPRPTVNAAAPLVPNDLAAPAPVGVGHAVSDTSPVEWLDGDDIPGAAPAAPLVPVDPDAAAPVGVGHAVSDTSPPAWWPVVVAAAALLLAFFLGLPAKKR